MKISGLSQAERQIAIDRFCSGRASVLFATDAAGEGLNLHEASRVVINLELPWNPMRLEQRIGRVDRIGQRRRVHAFHLIAAGGVDPVDLIKGAGFECVHLPQSRRMSRGERRNTGGVRRGAAGAERRGRSTA